MAPKQDPAEYVLPSPHHRLKSFLKFQMETHISVTHDTDIDPLNSTAKADVALLCNILMAVPELKLDNKSLATILGLSSPKNV